MRILRVIQSSFNYVESPETLTRKGLKGDTLIISKYQ
jgi:hypothetical protein